MALDTGATYTMIPWDIAEAIGYEPAYSKRKVTIITASGVEKAPLIVVDRNKCSWKRSEKCRMCCS